MCLAGVFKKPFQRRELVIAGRRQLEIFAVMALADWCRCRNPVARNNTTAGWAKNLGIEATPRRPGISLEAASLTALRELNKGNRTMSLILTRVKFFSQGAVLQAFHEAFE
jgi:hypothetical protein